MKTVWNFCQLSVSALSGWLGFVLIGFFAAEFYFSGYAADPNVGPEIARMGVPTFWKEAKLCRPKSSRPASRIRSVAKTGVLQTKACTRGRAFCRDIHKL